jgi:5'-phosphate synthase pdxT subunit
MALVAGVLALQGDFAAHARMLAGLGVEVREVRLPEHLAGLAALCMPGGESTAMSLLLDTTGLRGPLRQALAPAAAGGAGLPVLATCAGAILLAQRLAGDTGSRKVETLGLLDATVDRNAYGRQVNSFEAELEVDWGLLDGGAGGRPAPALFHGVFIRAPRIAAAGPAALVAGQLAGEPVLLRQGNILAATFHPELSGDSRLHQALLALAGDRDGG